MNLLDLSAKMILITGGARAIDRVVVKGLVGHVARVAVNDMVADDETAIAADQVAHL